MSFSGVADVYYVVSLDSLTLLVQSRAYEPPKAAKERVTTVPSKYKLPTHFRVWITSCAIIW